MTKIKGGTDGLTLGVIFKMLVRLNYLILKVYFLICSDKSLYLCKYYGNHIRKVWVRRGCNMQISF